MTYQVPQHIDTNKIFLVNRSEIEGRLDPKMALYNKKVQHALFPMVKLKNLLLSKPQYGANEAGLDRLNNTQPRYIRITDIDENGLISINELGATVANVDEKYILNNDDILIARSGATVGKTYLHKKLPYTCLYAGYLIRFLVDPQKILPGYLFSYTQLNSYKEWVNAIQRPSAQPNINAEEYQSIEIPLPDLPKQKEIVDFLSDAYLKKQQKEQQAEDILNSIDDFLHGELDIKLPETKLQTLQDRIFTVNISEIRDGRMDPKSVLFLGEHAKSETYENIQLKQIATIVKGDSITSDKVNKDGQYPVIAGGQTSPYNHDKYNFKGDVITVSASGAYSGYVWYHDNPIFASDCSVIHSKNSQFLTKYLFEVLKTQQSLIYLLQQGAGQPHVYPDDLGQLWIPVVSLPKQQEIVNHITGMRMQAKQLQAEGAEILQKAKSEVERMILGN
ncbi:MAG: restriction endonuclease subunit S [Bacteroidales bacterium]|nr:restriction endonuclease subunit S [Bacteroidales bacterium]